MDQSMLDQIVGDGGIEREDEVELSISGSGPIFTNRYRVDEVAAVAIGLAAASAAALWRTRTGQQQQVALDVRTAAAVTASPMFDLRDGHKLRPPDPNATSDFYEAKNGSWIHLHGGLPHLHEGTISLLGCAEDHESIAAAVRTWDVDELEEELAVRQMCAARARTSAEWKAHPQGKIVSESPAVELIKLGDSEPIPLPPASRPMSGVRVLEFARILAAPICGRTLAEHGADVLNVMAAKLASLEHCEISTGHGKRSCHLDLNVPEEYARVQDLARSADVFVHGYRTGGLERWGFGPHQLAQENPGIVYVSINCYGHEGPWVQRRGWEQLAQSTSGLALAQGAGLRPLKMPALSRGDTAVMTAPHDFTTGYLAAYGAMIALARRAISGGSWWVRVSLCQTAAWFDRVGLAHGVESAPGVGDVADLITTTESKFGNLTHLRPAADMSVTAPFWATPPVPRGSSEPSWLAS
jgi:crotonobetainyl-CoA:carnitine CoA-transferase CaiB-like acyl-CoA transferase